MERLVCSLVCLEEDGQKRPSFSTIVDLSEVLRAVLVCDGVNDEVGGRDCHDSKMAAVIRRMDGWGS